MKPGTEEPLRFRGPPGSLAAALRRPETIPRRLPVRVAMRRGKSGDADELVVRATRIEGDMLLQMSLPPRTPPGTYEGKVDVDGVARAVVIDVEPEVELQIVPDQLTLRAEPGEHVAIDLSVANAGNVAVAIRGAYAFGIFAAGGLERALHHAYTDRLPEGTRRVDYLGDRLADEHGGIVRVAVESGEGVLESGDVRTVTFNFHIPSDLHSGRTYTGTLPLHDVRYYIRLIVADGNEPPPLK